MMSPQVIADLARQQAVRAAAYEVEPYVPADRDEPLRWRSVPVPNIGDYRPAGWCLIEHVLVDKTGWGADWEPALTIEQFKQWASEKVDGAQNMGFRAGFAIIEEGQFQVVIGVFSDDPERWLECEDEQEAFNITWCERCEEPYEEGEGECPWCGHNLDQLP